MWHRQRYLYVVCNTIPSLWVIVMSSGHCPVHPPLGNPASCDALYRLCAQQRGRHTRCYACGPNARTLNRWIGMKMDTLDASTLSHPDIYGLLVMIDPMALSSTWICGKFWILSQPASFGVRCNNLWQNTWQDTGPAFQISLFWSP